MLFLSLTFTEVRSISTSFSAEMLFSKIPDQQQLQNETFQTKVKRENLGGRTSVSEPVLYCSKHFTCLRFLLKTALAGFVRNFDHIFQGLFQDIS